MSCYITVNDVKDLGIMPAEDIDELEARDPGVVLRIGTKVSGRFDTKLIKRYAAPFEEPYPDTLVDHVAAAVCFRLYLKRGFNPSSEQDSLIKEANDEAWKWLDEAANSEDGLIELPARQETPSGGSAVNKGGPLGYAEASPYTWMDVQREEVSRG